MTYVLQMHPLLWKPAELADDVTSLVVNNKGRHFHQGVFMLATADEFRRTSRSEEKYN